MRLLLAVASRRPSGLNATLLTLSLWPGWFGVLSAATVVVACLTAEMVIVGDESDLRERMRRGITGAVRRLSGAERVSGTSLVALLCASALAPVVAAGVVVGPVLLAAVGVVGGVGAGMLTNVVSDAVNRLRGDGKEVSQDSVENELAQRLEMELASQADSASSLREAVAALLQGIDAMAAVREAVAAHDQNLMRAIGEGFAALDQRFSEFTPLIDDLKQTNWDIQNTLLRQEANSREDRERARQDSLTLVHIVDMLERREVPPAGAADVGGQDPLWAGCPYVGLMPFQERDARVFYGRNDLVDRLVQRLLERLAGGGILLVVGASGVGKSSLLRAGLMPRVSKGALGPGSATWPRRVIRPTDSPLRALAGHLADLAALDPVGVYNSLSTAPAETPLLVERAVAAATGSGLDGEADAATAPPRLVLVIDQFEEMFTLSQDTEADQKEKERKEKEKEKEREAFIEALRAAAAVPADRSRHPPALVVAAVRADFMDRTTGYAPLEAAVQAGLFTVRPMSEAELREAITGPAAEAGLDAKRELVDAVVAELREQADGGLGSGALPLMSQAMAATWQQREGNELTLRAYRRAGGIADAVNRSATTAYDSLTSAQKDAARLVFIRLTAVTQDGQLARRRCRRDDLDAGQEEMTGDINAVINAFSAQRLIVLEEDSIEISHDALLGAWRQLKEWLGGDQRDRALYSQVVTDAAMWAKNERDPSYLYRSGRFAEVDAAAVRWADAADRYPPLPPISQEFLRAAHGAAHRAIRLRRAVIAGLLALTAVAIVAAGGIFLAARTANRNAALANSNAALATSRYLAAQSVEESGPHPSLGLLLAAYGLKLTDTTEARGAMLSSLWQRPQLLEVLEDHADPAWAISMLAYSPDGRRLAVASHDGTVVQWDVATGRPIGKPLGGTHNAAALGQQWILSVAYQPHGTDLAAGSGGGEITIWDAATGRKITSANFGVRVNSLAYSPDGKFLAIGFGDNAGTVAVLSLGTSKPPRLFRLGSKVFSVAFSPDGKLLAAGYGSGVVLWNLADPQAAPRRLSGGDGAQDLAFSPDSKLLACACDGIMLWPVQGTETAGKTLGSTSYIPYSVAFGRDGKTLASAGDDGYVRLWNLATLRQETPPLLASWKDSVYTLAFSPVTDTLASGSGDGQLLLWSEREQWPLGTSVYASGPDARVAAVSENGHLLAVTTSRGAALWDDQTGREIGPLPSLSGHPTSAAFNASGTSVLVGYDKGEVAVYDVKTRRLVVQGRPVPGGESVQSVAFSADGTVLIAADNAAPGHLDLWNARTGAPIGPPIYTGWAIDDLAADPQLNIAATASFDATVGLWDARTGKPLGTVTGHNDSVLSVAFSSDGRYLASGGIGGTVIVTDVQTGRTVSTLPITGNIDQVALDATGKTLAVATDTTVQLWDVATAREIGPPFALGVQVTALSFTDDGDLVSAVATNPPQIIRWNFDASTWIHTACAIASRDLTVQERDQFIGAGFSGVDACRAA